MTKFTIGSVVIWREPDPEQAPGEGEPRFIERCAEIRQHGQNASGIYTEIEVDDGRVLQIHPEALRPIVCLHPEHRLGTHGRLKSNQRVCMTCGDVVLVRRR